MTLTELRYIVAVARERHFGHAAERCFVSQPTLSVAVKKLEDELGVTLFERGKNEVTITPVGERIIAQAHRALEEAEAVKQIAEEGKDQLRGPLRLGAIYTIGPYLLPNLVPEMRESSPDMPLIVQENYTAKLAEDLKHGDLDVIIISLPFSDPGVETAALYDEPFVVVLPSSHPWQERESVATSELSRETVLLLGAGHCFRDQVVQVCPECVKTGRGSGELQGSLEGGSLETIRHMVASGIGITVLPCTAAGADRYAQRLLAVRRFKGKTPNRRVALAWRKSFPRPQAVAALRDAIIACKPTCVSLIDE